MKTRTIIASAISCLITAAFMQSGHAQTGQIQTEQVQTGQAQTGQAQIGQAQTEQAQTEQVSQPQSPYLTDSISHPVTQLNQQGTFDLQEKVLTQINDGLFNGRLSAAQASQFKNQLNKLNDQESWYKSLNRSIPVTVRQENTVVLNEMIKQLQPTPSLSAKTENSLHSDIDELVSKALARNHISSGEAEKYYLRLAQIESNLESTKGESGGASNQTAATNQTLRELKSELQHKATCLCVHNSPLQ